MICSHSHKNFSTCNLSIRHNQSFICTPTVGEQMIYPLISNKPIVSRGYRKENLTYTPMVKWLKPYRLMKELKDYKTEHGAHIHAKYSNARGSGSMIPRKLLKSLTSDIKSEYIFMILTFKILLATFSKIMHITYVI